MRILAVLAVIALLIIAAIIHFGNYDFGGAPMMVESPSPAQAQAAPPAANAQGDFTGVAASLANDMQSVPASLDAPGVPPRAAFNVKSRLGSLVSTRKEYHTLVQACDLIIYADQEHSVRQLQAKQAQQSVSGDLMGNAKANQVQVTAGRESVHAKAQADWEIYRRRTDQEVSRLLGSLQSPHP